MDPCSESGNSEFLDSKLILRLLSLKNLLPKTSDYKCTVPFCGFRLVPQANFCCSCGKNISFIFTGSALEQAGTSEERKEKHAQVLFQNVRATKEKGRRSCFKKKTPRKESHVKISIGIMTVKDGVLKPLRGSVLSLEVPQGIDGKQLQKAAEQKIKDFNKNLPCGPYVLLYPDGSVVKNIPGTETPFSLQLYKKAVGKPYQRITLYICIVEEFVDASEQLITSDSSDLKVSITSRSRPEFNAADRLVSETTINSSSARDYSVSSSIHSPAQFLVDIRSCCTWHEAADLSQVFCRCWETTITSVKSESKQRNDTH